MLQRKMSAILITQVFRHASGGGRGRPTRKAGCRDEADYFQIVVLCRPGFIGDGRRAHRGTGAFAAHCRSVALSGQHGNHPCHRRPSACFDRGRYHLQSAAGTDFHLSSSELLFAATILKHSRGSSWVRPCVLRYTMHPIAASGISNVGKVADLVCPEFVARAHMRQARSARRSSGHKISRFGIVP
jgi:hypothetical protein